MNPRIQQLNDLLRQTMDACPEIVFISDPVLRQKTNQVSLEEGLQIGEVLKKVLEKYRSITGLGRGLAAPQIGESKAVFVTFMDEAFKTYMNPKIVTSSEKCNLYRELCISCGYVSADVKRPESVEIEYMNESGEIVREQASSFLARLIQHECDHLMGIVNVDKAQLGSIEFMVNDPLLEKLREC